MFWKNRKMTGFGRFEQLLQAKEIFTLARNVLTLKKINALLNNKAPPMSVIEWSQGVRRCKLTPDEIRPMIEAIADYFSYWPHIRAAIADGVPLKTVKATSAKPNSVQRWLENKLLHPQAVSVIAHEGYAHAKFTKAQLNTAFSRMSGVRSTGFGFGPTRCAVWHQRNAKTKDIAAAALEAYVLRAVEKQQRMTEAEVDDMLTTLDLEWDTFNKLLPKYGVKRSSRKDARGKESFVFYFNAGKTDERL